MVTYASMVGWTKCYELILNRMDLINQLLGYGVSGENDNPCKIDYSHGHYVVSLFGATVNEFSPYDYPTAEMVSQRLDAMESMLWHVGRNGFLLPRANMLL